MKDIFLSYSKTDAGIADHLVKRLEREGWSVFIDRHLQVGKRWPQEIEQYLHNARAVVVLWSAQSRDSDYVLEEAEYGKRKGILFPALIESVEYPYGFGRIHTANLVGWENGEDHSGLTDLLVSLQSHLNDTALDSEKNVGESGQIITPTLPAPGHTFRDKLKIGGEGPLMVVIPPGRFLMGAAENEDGHYEFEGPQHEVHIARPFAMGVYTVTFDDYDDFCQHTGREKTSDNGWGRGTRPAINVSWHEAQDYCRWLSEQTRRDYRLPSEAEWEYACRAGSQTPYYTGTSINPDQANFDSNVDRTAPVGSYPPNDFGLYDMHGNVWEWCQDNWHDNYDSAPTDGSAWIDSESDWCVVRGGSWYSHGMGACSARRSRNAPAECEVDLGFRLALGH